MSSCNAPAGAAAEQAEAAYPQMGNQLLEIRNPTLQPVSAPQGCGRKARRIPHKKVSDLITIVNQLSV